MRAVGAQNEKYVAFYALRYLGKETCPESAETKLDRVIEDGMQKLLLIDPREKIEVAVEIPKSPEKNGKIVVYEISTCQELFTFPIRNIDRVAAFERKSTFALACNALSAGGDGSRTYEVHCFETETPDVSICVVEQIRQAFNSSSSQVKHQMSSEPQVVQLQMSLDIKEEDSRGQWVPCSRNKECFKLRCNVEKKIVISIDSLTQPCPLVIGRCFGVLISPGRHVRHSDMQLIGTGKDDSPQSPSPGFYVSATWDPKENPSFVLLNQEGHREGRVYMTVACDLVLQKVREPVRFVFETQARIIAQQSEKYWPKIQLTTAKPLVEIFTLHIQESSDGYELVKMVTSSGRVLHPIEQSLNDSGGSDDDEPLLSGTGQVDKASGWLDEWSEIFKKWIAQPTNRPKEVDQLIVQYGVPQAMRGKVWQLLATNDTDQEDYQEYRRLINLENIPSVDQAIERDINRTFPGHEFFKEASGQEALYRICKAYSLRDPAVSYCQGLSFLAAALLLHLPEEQAFFILNMVMSNEKYNMRQLYLDNFENLHVKLFQMKKLYTEKIPEIGIHFEDLGVEPHMFASQWLLTLYTAKFPLYLVFLVLDNFLLSGPDTLFKIAVAILMESKRDLLTLDFEGVLKHFRVSIPRKYRNEAQARSLIETACKVKLSSNKLKKWEKEYQQYKLDNADPLISLQIENQRLMAEQVRLDQENDDLAQELVTTRIQLKKELDSANDRIDVLQKDLGSSQQHVNDLSTENKELAEQVTQLKEMLRREAEQAEGTIKQLERSLAEYKRICCQLEEFRQAVQADMNRNRKKANGEDIQDEESALERQLRELELELAQTKLALVESECRNQELMHKLNSPKTSQSSGTGMAAPWLSKTLQTIIKKQNSQVDS